VLADEAGLQELRGLGARMVPVVSRGRDWVDGQALQALADFVGVRWTHRMLAPADLVVRVNAVLSAAARFSAQLPPYRLAAMLPNGFRSYASLATHIGQIVEAFLDQVENGVRLEESAYVKPVPAHITTPGALAAFQDSVRGRFNDWWRAAGSAADFAAPANVYYGEQTLHEFFERSAWHSAQHTRQLQLLIETLGIAPNHPLVKADLAGLPLPENVWDDKMVFAT
jgi:hypothetical protein